MSHKFVDKVRKTFVLYREDIGEGEFKLRGPDLQFSDRANIDSLSINEIFVITRAFNESPSEGITVNEFFDVRKTQDQIEVLADALTANEDFAKEHVIAKQEAASDGFSINEAFTEQLIEAIQKSTNDSLAVNEVFSKNLLNTVLEEASDNLTVSEIFNSRLIQTINKFTTDSLVVSEVFTKQTIKAIIKVVSDSLTLNEVFSQSKEVLQPPTNLSFTHLIEGNNQLSWDQDGRDPDHYELEISTGGGFSLVDGNISGSSRSYNHAGCGTDYNNNDIVSYRLRGCDGGACTGWNTSSSKTITNC